MRKLINGGTMEITARERISTGFLKMDKLTIKMPDGNEMVREVMQKKDVVAVLAITDDKRVILCKQPRAGANELESIEIPAGLIDEGETPEAAAKRELLEETGYETAYLKKLGYFFSDPACCNSKTYLFFTDKVKKVAEQHLDESEFLEYFDVSLKEMKELVERCIIHDANSTIAYYRAQKYWPEA